MIRLVSAWVLVNGLLMAPSWLAAEVGRAPHAPWISIEAALIVAAMALLPRRPWSRGLAWCAALAVVLAGAVQLADVGFQVSLGRPLNLSLDLYLIDAVRRLAVGNVGLLRTILLLALGIVAAALAVLGTAWLLTPSSTDEGATRPGHEPKLAGILVGGTAALALLGLAVPALSERVATPAASVLASQWTQLRATRAERATFAGDLARPPDPVQSGTALLSELEGRHVVVAYIESYGMAALDDPELAAVVRPRLQSVADRFDSAGIHMATGTLVSPTVGGQSWYAHGTMLSGLWLENQLRYRLLLASDRETLVDDFRRAGHRTATVMPAITTAWPEAVRLGYDDVYTSANIPYLGPPFYWVTMPDQYTWSFLGRLLQKGGDPLFVEVGMVSSHAPWTPVLPLVAWDAMQDGAVFEPYRRDGYPPEEIWWDVQALRDGYAQSIGYSLEVMAQFALRFLDDRTLLVVPGDHQAAPWVTGEEAREVPVHVIARDRALVDPFLDWGFGRGGFPEPASPPHGMDEFRPWLLRAFSGSRNAWAGPDGSGG